MPELAPIGTEPLIDKKYGDSFEDTDLSSVLSNLGVGRIFVVGAQTDACIRSTLHGAFVRGYDTTLVSDAHTPPRIRQHGVLPLRTLSWPTRISIGVSRQHREGPPRSSRTGNVRFGGSPEDSNARGPSGAIRDCP